MSERVCDLGCDRICLRGSQIQKMIEENINLEDIESMIETQSELIVEGKCGQPEVLKSAIDRLSDFLNLKKI